MFKYVVLYILFATDLAMSEEQCPSEPDFTCGSDDLKMAALCLKKSSKGKREDYCESDVFKEIYELKGACTPSMCEATIKDHCKDKPCGAGECLRSFGAYFCKCPSGSRSKQGNEGKDCSEQGKQDAQGVYFAYEQVTTPGRRNAAVFVTRGSPLKIHITATASGEVTKLSTEKMKFDKAQEMCFGFMQTSVHENNDQTFNCRFIPKDLMLFANFKYYVPYVDDEPGILYEYQPKSDRDEPAYRIEHLELKVFDSQSMTLQYIHNFQQVTKFKVHECPTPVKILNCGKSSDKPLEIAAKASETLRSTFVENVDCPTPEKKYRWNVIKYDETNSEELEIDLDTGENAGVQPEFTIEPYKLKLGLYTVKCTVTTFGMRRFANNPYVTTNFAVCFVRVAELSLVARIKGGDTRTVYTEKMGQLDFKFDASESFDPNKDKEDQDHLTYSWACIKPPQGTKCVPGSHRTPTCWIYGPVNLTEFEFELELGAPGVQSVKATQSVTISLKKQVEMVVACSKNCPVGYFKTNPRESVYMEARIVGGRRVSSTAQITWSCTKNDTEVCQTSPTAIGSPTLLIQKENTLTPDTKYKFSAKLVDTEEGSEGSASLTIQVSSVPESGTCQVVPNEGIKFKTLFDINCVGFSDKSEISQLRFEFYQKSPNSNVTEKFIGFNITGVLARTVLTESMVMVKASNMYGVFSDFVIVQVNLTDWTPRLDRIFQLLDEAEDAGLSGDIVAAIRLGGAMVDAMEYVEEKIFVIHRILSVFEKQKISGFSDIKLLASALSSVVNKGIPQLDDGMDSECVKSMGSLLASMAGKLDEEVHKVSQIDSALQTKDILDVVVTILESTDAIVNSTEDTLFDLTTGSLRMFKLHDNFKKGTSRMINGLGFAAMSIVRNLLPGENETIVSSNGTTMWIKLDKPTALADMTGIPPNEKTQLRLPKTLGKSLENEYEDIAVEVTTIKMNPFWWDGIDKNIVSDVVSIRFWENPQQKMSTINSISEPIDIYLSVRDITYQIISGQVTQPGDKDCVDEADKMVAVHTLAATGENSNGMVFVEMLNFNESDEFIVLLTENIRPDYASMINNGTVVDLKSSSLRIYFVNISRDTFHFVGILPGDKVPAKKTVAYTFRTYSVQCKVRHETVWTSPACVIGENTTEEVVHCRCSHLSLFGSSIFVAPNAIHPIDDLYLFATLADNPYVFSLIVSLLVLYFALLIWTCREDRRNMMRGRIIVLDDNYPGDSCPYLIVVYTAFNVGAATDAKIGIRLLGENQKIRSRAHVLQCYNQKVFRRNADDWFLLFTRYSLGKIEAIHLWHNSAGSHPDWYCKRVKVFDIKQEEVFIFLIDQWLSVWPGEFLEVLAKAVPPVKANDWKQCVVQNLVFNLQEQHIWVSIFLSHPRTTVSKSQRLAMTVCIIMVTFLTGMMFYKVGKEDDAVDEDKYEIKMREIIVVVQCSIISAITSSLVAMCFKRGQVVTPPVKGKTTDDQMSLHPKDRTGKGRLLKYIIASVKNVVKGKPLMPVVAGKESSESIVKRKRWTTTGWILSQVIIFVSAYLVILYGLKMGKVLSELWASTAVVSFLNGIFCTAPLKIVLFAATLATFGETNDSPMFDCVIEHATRKEFYGNTYILQYLIQLRSQGMYQPLNHKETHDLRRKTLIRNRTLQNIELATTILFCFILLHIAGDIWNEPTYYVNDHISRVLANDQRQASIALEDVVNATRLTDYVIDKLLPNLYKENWYNQNTSLTTPKESLSEMGWFSDSVKRLVGTPRIRQIRVPIVNCSMPLLNLSSSKCLPAFRKDIEDTLDYGFRWGSPNTYINQPLQVPFSFQTRDNVGLELYGESGTSYHSGGYMVALKDTQKGCNKIISDLIDDGWWNIRMRAFIVEFSLFNPNAQSYTSVSVVTEHLLSGGFTNRMLVTTVYLTLSFSFLIIFVIILGSFNFRLLLTVNRCGFFNTLTHFWGFYDLLLMLLCNTAVIFEIIKVLRVAVDVHVFQETGTSDFFQFSKMVFYEKVSMWLWSLTLCLAPIRIFKFESILTVCRFACTTFQKCWTHLAAVGVVICILFAFQVFVLNFTVCPTIRHLDFDIRYRRGETPATLYQGLQGFQVKVISWSISMTSAAANIVLQVIIIYHYKIMSN